MTSDKTVTIEDNVTFNLKCECSIVNAADHIVTGTYTYCLLFWRFLNGLCQMVWHKVKTATMGNCAAVLD